MKCKNWFFSPSAVKLSSTIRLYDCTIQGCPCNDIIASESHECVSFHDSAHFVLIDKYIVQAISLWFMKLYGDSSSTASTRTKVEYCVYFAIQAGATRPPCCGWCPVRVYFTCSLSERRDLTAQHVCNRKSYRCRRRSPQEIMIAEKEYRVDNLSKAI